MEGMVQLAVDISCRKLRSLRYHAMTCYDWDWVGHLWGWLNSHWDRASGHGIPSDMENYTAWHCLDAIIVCQDIASGCNPQSARKRHPQRHACNNCNIIQAYTSTNHTKIAQKCQELCRISWEYPVCITRIHPESKISSPATQILMTELSEDGIGGAIQLPVEPRGKRENVCCCIFKPDWTIELDLECPRPPPWKYGMSRNWVTIDYMQKKYVEICWTCKKQFHLWQAGSFLSPFPEMARSPPDSSGLKAAIASKAPPPAVFRSRMPAMCMAVRSWQQRARPALESNLAIEIPLDPIIW